MKVFEPIRYPNLDQSAFVQHKTIPAELKPQSVVPEKFLNAIAHPKSDDAKTLEKALDPLNSVNQSGSGTNAETERALQQPIKVKHFRLFFCLTFAKHCWIKLSHLFSFQITQFELKSLLNSPVKLNREERKRLKELLASSDSESEVEEKKEEAKHKQAKR